MFGITMLVTLYIVNRVDYVNQPGCVSWQPHKYPSTLPFDMGNLVNFKKCAQEGEPKQFLF